MSARRRPRRRRVFTLGERFRRMLHGLVYTGLGTVLMGAVSAFAAGASKYLNINVTIAGQSFQVPLGDVTNVAVGFAGVFMIFYGIRYLLGVRL